MGSGIFPRAEDTPNNPSRCTRDPRQEKPAPYCRETEEWPRWPADQHVRDQQRKIFDAAAFGHVHAHGIGRSRGFKTHAEEDHFVAWIFLGDFNSVQRRIDHAHVSARAFDLK